MPRVTFLEPSAELSAQDLADVLMVVTVRIPASQVARWTELEQTIAYDWAVREHLHASDNLVRRRKMPHFLATAAAADKAAGDAAHSALVALADEMQQHVDRLVESRLVIGPFTAAERCVRLARFAAVQARDGFPDEDTGMAGHCRACHDVDGDPGGPRCGHTAGCPEC